MNDTENGMERDDDLLARAGDYVLGLMNETEREQADRDLENDAVFRDAVTRFAGAMQALDRTAASETVPAGLWNEVADRISDMPQMPRSGDRMPHGTFATMPAPSDGRASGRLAAPLPAKQSWRPFAMAASLLAACGIGYLAGSTTAPHPSPVVIVVLETELRKPGAVFEAFADDTVRIIPLQDFVVPEGKTLQVWTLYDPAVGPISLGTLSRAEEAVIKGPGLPTPKPDQLYEITLEPAPGSPTGRPTGPILVKGYAMLPPGKN